MAMEMSLQSQKNKISRIEGGETLEPHTHSHTHTYTHILFGVWTQREIFIIIMQEHRRSRGGILGFHERQSLF